MEKTVHIEGMMCKHCQKHVQKALDAIEGIEAEVILEDNCAKVTYDGEFPESAIKSAVSEAGYEVTGIE